MDLDKNSALSLAERALEMIDFKKDGTPMHPRNRRIIAA